MMTASFESLGNLVGTVLMQSLFPCSSLLSGYAEGLIFYVKSVSPVAKAVFPGRS